MIKTEKKRKLSVCFEENSGSTARKKARGPSSCVEPECVRTDDDNPVRSTCRYNLRPRVSRGSYRGHTR